MDQQAPVQFLEGTNMLLLNLTAKKAIVKITVLNQWGETIERMQLINGRHQLDLSALPHGEYSIRLQSGDDVTVKKISVH